MLYASLTVIGNVLMPASLPANLITQLKALILPYMRDKDDREALLIEAFYFRDPRPLNEINLDGSPEVFTIRLIAGLHAFGCLALEGERLHALAALLLTIHGRCGEDKQREIMAIMPLISGLCQPTASKSETVSETPSLAPPSNPIQSVKTPSAERMPTVFISYSHMDKAIAEKLIADLGRAGHACWIDKAEIKGGDEWMQSITAGINNSYAFILLVSDDANRSTWVRREFLWAEHKQKPIYPVLVAPCELPIYMVERQITDVLTNYAIGLHTLLTALPSPRVISLEVDDASIVRSVLATEPRPFNRRELELAYMDRMRFEEFQIQKYVALSGDAHLASKTRRTGEKLTMHPDLMRQEFAHTPWVREGEREARHFEDTVSELLAIRRAVVLGEPGAGKTTTLWRLARALYDVAQRDSIAPLPLLVKLGKWTNEEQSLTAFIAAELGELGSHLDKLLKENCAALLLDGLNEIPAAQQKRKYEQVETFINQHPQAMAIVTCRKQDYTDLRLDQVEIAPLDPLRIREFAVRSLGNQDGAALFWKLAGESAQKQEQAFREEFAQQRADWERLFWLADTLPDRLEWDYKNKTWKQWQRERDNPSGLMLLAHNPYMLRMLAEVYMDRDGDLPPNRGELFKSFVEQLLIREGIAWRDEYSQLAFLSAEGEALLVGLAQLAYTMQIQRATEEDGNALTVLPLADVKVLLTDRLLYLGGSTSLLMVGDEVRFSHQLLQEYFAAIYLRDRIFGGTTSTLSGAGWRMLAPPLQSADIWKPDTWWERTNWEEAVILLAGLYSDDCTPVLNWLADANPEVAAQCIVRSGATTPDTTKIRLRNQWLPRLIDLRREPQPPARAAVGRALGLFQINGRMADNRKGVGLRADGLPDLDWVEIPAGEFISGEEKWERRQKLPRFFITRYLVTYEQFSAFLTASDGFYNTEWWDGLGVLDKHKAQPGEQRFKYGNHPREMVNWYETVAFTRWLSAKFGYEITLPTEEEYERAARWLDGRIYPWGNEYISGYANIDETSENVGMYFLEQSSAVGIYSQGSSVEGVHDLFGNMWEWSLDGIEGDLGSRKFRVQRLCGGSWCNDLETSLTRYDFDAETRFEGAGLRLFCSFPQ